MNADINRRLENLIRFGTIKTVNPSKPIPLVTVDLEDIVTPEIRFFNARSGDDSTWDPPSLDEEVMVISPCGEIGPTSVVFYGLYNNEHPSPSDELNKKIRVFSDGCIISYDIATHHLSAILPPTGTIEVTANGGVTVNANGGVTVNANDGLTINAVSGGTTHNGNLLINGSSVTTGNNTVGGSQLVQGSSHSKGDFSTEGDVKAGDISLKSHKTSGVQPGDGESGGPIP
ncbi:phage baseplate assembly protein V [Acinetobacter baumannii]|uniref:phage baseplate assembly protein V n=1 Tax=Acinetobacter baumannii TaxID=470 RepID=UPI0005F9916C|nr:phage baseplate assembly protein V [Acinetobacter baumannii]KJX73464.1 baseplate assembly protein [Acinetobacter baumannii]MCO9032188.1 phage baseplate assembly protein V [Acinetobacter baumannii]MCO9037085.1 phage baseplate assembly protein V [Acinetobacter baumannii]MCO9041350.1 phage baseplate assembly protein V [Acinetobacter baumannii]USZ92108.1 phage baseplate assembly protein V [Acinetobacter baumannii]